MNGQVVLFQCSCAVKLKLIESFVRGTIIWERLISSVVRGDYYVGEDNIICCKRDYYVGEESLLQQMILISPT
jgi:hypothetical protein